ncbi:MAG: ABC transporter substrate-binding protein [Lachnospiraceae bacterium]|nr:ABC transporter substrate-binding protein [Lachnospiraceae bacterium]
MRKQVLSAAVISFLMLTMAACGSSQPVQTTAAAAETTAAAQEAAAAAAETTAAAAETTAAAETAATSEAPAAGEKILKTAASFAYPSLDVHTEYYGWYTSIYGLSEALFKIGPDMGLVPCLAESAETEGNVMTIRLKEAAAFSNGNPLTAEMVIRNLQRLAEVNSRFAFLGNFEYAAVDDHTLTIDTKEPYPTLMNDLASPECGMIDLDATTDFDLDPVCTGPFVISSFVPSGDVTVKRNENYWGGDVTLDGAVFYYMQEDQPKLMAMQSGELDCYNSIDSASLQIYLSEPENYKVVQIAGTRLQFYILNENRLSDKVREAINLIVDKDAIAAYQEGTVSPAVGPFLPSAAYGQVTVPAVDPEKAKSLLEEDGYTLGADGIYEKDGEKLHLNICYYAARNLDAIAILMQEQLKNNGFDVELTVEEDPDATYIATGDFDIALYCMISDKAGDPLYFLDSTLAEGSYYDCGGFDDDECQAAIEQLRIEADPAKRAELANKAVQIAIDDNAFGYVGLFNQTTVLKPGVSGFAEDIPFDFYGVDAHTTKE